MIKLKLTPVTGTEGEEKPAAPARILRLPERLLRRYGIGDAVAIELAPDGLILRPIRSGKLSWRATAASLARHKEGWAFWDGALTDGLETL